MLCGRSMRWSARPPIVALPVPLAVVTSSCVRASACRLSSHRRQTGVSTRTPAEAPVRVAPTPAHPVRGLAARPGLASSRHGERAGPASRAPEVRWQFCAGWLARSAAPTPNYCWRRRPCCAPRAHRCPGTRRTRPPSWTLSRQPPEAVPTARHDRSPGARGGASRAPGVPSPRATSLAGLGDEGASRFSISPPPRRYPHSLPAAPTGRIRTDEGGGHVRPPARNRYPLPRRARGSSPHRLLRFSRRPRACCSPRSGEMAPPSPLRCPEWSTVAGRTSAHGAGQAA